MRYPTCWDADRVRSVLTTESRQKERELFLQTHRPFQMIRVDFCKEPGSWGPFIPEEELRAIVQSGPVDAHNRLFFVVGEAGSGKSELCQWLEYMVDPDARLAVHIPRSMTSAAHVVALLRDRLGADVALSRAPIATQADHVALSAVVLLYERGGTLAPPDLWAPVLLSAGLRAEIAAHLAQAGDVAHEPLLPDSQVRELCSLHGVAVASDRVPAVAAALRLLIGQALEQTLWLGDMRRLLAQLSDVAVQQGRRPLLLLEDITAFQILGDLLLDYLLDLTSGHFDAVIGVTTGFEQTQLAGATLVGDLTHIHHRLRARFVLSDDQGRSFGLEEELVNLARAYLGAITVSDAAWAHADGAFDGLYPFTEIALRRAFDSLHEEGNPRQTPRLLLEHVIGAALLGSEPPPITLDRSSYLVRPPALFRSEDGVSEDLASLLRWYGEIGEEDVTLDARIATLWGVTAPEHLFQDGRIRVPRAYITLPPSSAPPDADWQGELRELQRWMALGGRYPSRETLKRGVERAILWLGDPRSLGSQDALSPAQATIYYTRGDERLPIFIEDGSGDQDPTGSYVKVRVGRAPEDRAILEELVYLELSGAEPAHVCHNLALTLEWARRHWDSYHQEVRTLLREQMGGLTAEQLILSAWRLLHGLIGPGDDYLSSETPSLDDDAYDRLTPWSPERQAICYTTGRALWRWQDIVRRLFIGAFTLRETLLDQERYVAGTSDLDIRADLERLARLRLDTLRSLPFKVRPGGHAIQALLLPLQRYARALHGLDVPAAWRSDMQDLRRREEHLQAQQHLDHPALGRRLRELHWRCGEVGVTWHESWDVALETLTAITPEDLHVLVMQVSELRGGAGDRLSDDIWAYQEFRHALRPVIAHPYWSAAATVRRIQDELLRAGQERYRRDARMLVSTAAYRELLQVTRRLRQELIDD